MKQHDIKKISDIIDIKQLEHETQKLFYSGLGIAVVFLTVLSIFMQWERIVIVKEEYRQITTELITIPPRMTESLEIVKKDVKVKALQKEKRDIRLPDGEIPVKSPPAIDELPDRYIIDVDSLISAVRAELDRELMKRIKSYDDLARIVFERYYEDLTIRRDPYGRSKISLREELLSIKDFDFGKYKGFIYQDFENKQALEGFVYIPASVWGTILAPVDSVKRAIAGLAEAFTKFTGITVHVDKQVFLDSAELLDYPFLYINADNTFDLSHSEKENLRNYLHNGGFVFLEAYGRDNPELPPMGAAPLKNMLKDTLGEEFSLTPIPNDHPLYHCFFDLEDGPPRRAHNYDILPGIQLPSILEGVFIGDRLVAIYSEKSYGEAWNMVVPPEEFQKIGVNAVVFGRIQKRGNTNKKYENAGIIQ